MRFSLAAERLVAWQGREALGALSEALKRADQPLFRRVGALSALSAGATRSQVRSILSEFEENLLTREMLEATNFKRAQVKRDYAGN
jgi:hypothetical protein